MLEKIDQEFQVNDWQVMVRDRYDAGSWTSKTDVYLSISSGHPRVGFWLDLVACSGAVWKILVDTLVVLNSFVVASVIFSTAEALEAYNRYL